MPRERTDRPPDAGYVLISTDIWKREEFRSLTRHAQWLYLDGLIELVRRGHADLLPHEYVTRAFPRRRREADIAVAQLVASELWNDLGLAYQVNTWLGCQVFLGLTRARISNGTREAVYARDGRTCVQCGATERLSLDHITPWSAGGSDKPDNLRTLCVSCNSRKGARRL